MTGCRSPSGRDNKGTRISEIRCSVGKKAKRNHYIQSRRYSTGNGLLGSSDPDNGDRDIFHRQVLQSADSQRTDRPILCGYGSGIVVRGSSHSRRVSNPVYRLLCSADMAHSVVGISDTDFSHSPVDTEIHARGTGSDSLAGLG